jgi:murein DD-endopeptidase MepM/ murein hydrolase activator NlpD
VRTGRQKYEFVCEQRSGFPVSTAIGIFVLCAVGVSFLFLNFSANPAIGVQLSHNMPQRVPDFSEETTACEVPQAQPVSRPNDRPAPSPCSQEVADTSGPGDTLFSLLYANLLDETAARTVAVSLAQAMQPSAKKGFDAYAALAPGTRYSITLDQNGAFQKITLELDPAHIFVCETRGNTVFSWKEDVVVDFKVETLKLKVDGSLEKTVLNAGEGQTLASELRNIFQWDIDFQYDSLRGDECTVLFERRYFDDKPSGYGRILSAIYDGKKTGRRVGILFDGKYYSEDALQLEKDFLRTPLKVVRITSKFGMRFHPVMREWRQHQGVDYGAPTGTPVLAVSRGVVVFAGWQNGYGNYVCIKHDNGFESRYGHLSKIFVRKGLRVKQGQRIGLVGQTGVATGPHLDFQLLAKGKHINPLDTRKVKMAQSPVSVPGPLRNRFQNIAAEALSRLDGATSIQLSRRADAGRIR